MRQAVPTALLLLGLLVGAALLGRLAFFFVVCGVVLLALYELLVALRSKGANVVVPLGLACGFAVLLVAYLEEPAWFGIVAIGTVYASVLAAMRPGRGPHAGTDAAWTVFGVAWIAGGGAGATGILMLEDGILLLVGVVAVIALDDIGAYFTGVNLGKRRLAPTISPGKSWEGAIGGSACALATGVAVAVVLGLNVVDGLALGAIAGVLAPVGDLVESLVKREIGIKDSGSLLPGHGGMLDRLDAILFCAPAMFLYLNAFTA